MATTSTFRPTFRIPGIPRLFDAPFGMGLTVFAIYLTAGLPVQVAAFRQLGIAQDQASAWFFITWLTTGAVSIAVALAFRQPISINLSIPALILLANSSGQFTVPQLLGANLAAGLMAIAFGVLGVSARLARWVPFPIIMGMFAGTLFGVVSRMVGASFSDFTVAAPAVLGYLAARAMGGTRVLPLAVAVVVGLAASLITGRMAPTSIHWELPAASVYAPEFSLSAFVAVSLPILLLTAGTGNVQSLGFLRAEGYAVRSNVLTIVAGLTSMANSLFGGHVAAVGGTSTAIIAGPDSGEPAGRYKAVVTASIPTIIVAIAAVPVMMAIQAVSTALVLVVAGLAVLGSFQRVFEMAFGGGLRLGALVAFTVTVTGAAYAGIPPAVWALLAGILVSLFAEKAELLNHWSNVR